MFVKSVIYPQPDVFPHRRFAPGLAPWPWESHVYTQKALHRGAFTHRRVYTQNACYTEQLLHTEGFTQRSFTHGRVYTQKALNRGAFNQRRLYTGQLFSHRSSHARTSLYAQNLFAQSRFYTEQLLRIEVFTQRSFYTQMRIHADALHLEAFKLLQWEPLPPFVALQNCNFTPVFASWPLFRSKVLHLRFQKWQFYKSFWRSTFILCERVAAEVSKSQFCHWFWRPTFILREEVCVWSSKM